MRRYYEFALSVIIVGVLGIVLTDRIGRTRRDAEEAVVRAEVGAIQAQILEAVTHRETFGGSLPDSDNPVDWLAEPLPDYRGVFDTVPDAHCSCWYFDRRQRLLVYRFRDGHAARFRLVRTGRTDNQTLVTGVGLQRVDDQSPTD